MLINLSTTPVPKSIIHRIQNFIKEESESKKSVEALPLCKGSDEAVQFQLDRIE